MRFLCVTLMCLTCYLVRVRSSRNQACNLLIAVDQTAYPMYQSSPTQLTQKVLNYLEALNSIYQRTILKDPPYENIYFKIGEIRLLQNFMVGCENKDVILAEFTKIAKSSNYCLAHLLTSRDFGCVIGLATIGGLCKKYGNVGFTKVDRNDSIVINTMAHEIGHNFGSDHDGADQIQYRSCNGSKAGIMSTGQYKKFSTCSLSAMHAKLQKVLKKEEDGEKCFLPEEYKERTQVTVNSEDLKDHKAACPTLPPDDCQDRPDPPEVPEPPPEPVCGDLNVEEPFEECDCGVDYIQCQDPCCYPAELSQYDLDLNASALPCHRNKKQVCLSPYKAPVRFGLMFPILFILLLILILAIILWVDWRCGKRRLYFHITEREERRNEPLHVETEEQKERRLGREREQVRLRA